MILILVPAFNEEKTIGRVVRDLFEHGFTNVIVIDDGSTDATSAIAREAGAVVLAHEVNRGQGAALQTGNEYALRKGAEMVVHFDADGQFNPADVQPALEKLRVDGYDVILGSRFLDQRSKIPWLKKYFLLPFSRWIQNVFIGTSLTDVHNGFRVLNRHALETISIEQDRMAHNSEIVVQIQKQQLRFAEFPVQVTYHEYGQGAKGVVEIVSDLALGTIFKK